MFWNYFHNRFAKLVQKGTVDEVFQLLDSDYEFPEKAQKALILRKNEAEIRGYFIRKRTLSDANQVLLIEQIPSEIFDLIDHQSVCDKAAEMIVQQGNSDCIKLLLHQQNVSEKLQNMVVKRNISPEIIALLLSQSISDETADTIVKRGVEAEIEALLKKNIVSKEMEQVLIARGNAAEQTLAVKSGLQRQESVSQIIDCGHHEAIMALLQTIEYDSPVHLSPEDRDKIIFRDNLEEIKAFIENDFLATEKGIIHLIDLELYSCAAKFLNRDCRGYSPITEKVIMAVLEKGDELLGTTLVHHQDQLLFQLKRMQRTQEWLENRVLERGYNNEISCLARIYKVSRLTIEEILRRNNKQEIKALIDSKNINDACVYDLIDRQRYDLLENYARCVPNNPTFYLLTKYMKAHR